MKRAREAPIIIIDLSSDDELPSLKKKYLSLDAPPPPPVSLVAFPSILVLIDDVIVHHILPKLDYTTHTMLLHTSKAIRERLLYHKSVAARYSVGLRHLHNGTTFFDPIATFGTGADIQYLHDVYCDRLAVGKVINNMLKAAVLEGNIGTLSALKELGYRPRYSTNGDHKQNNLVYYAASNGNFELVEWIHHTFDETYWHRLFPEHATVAAENHHYAFVRAYIDHIGSQDYFEQSSRTQRLAYNEYLILGPLMGILASHGNLEMLQWAQDRGFLYNIEPILHKGAESGKLNTVQWLLETNWKIGVVTAETMRCAFNGRSIPVIEYLLTKGSASIDPDAFTPYTWAGVTNNVTLMEWAQAKGYPFTLEQVKSLLHFDAFEALDWAVREGFQVCDTEIFLFCLKNLHVEGIEWLLAHNYTPERNSNAWLTEQVTDAKRILIDGALRNSHQWSACTRRANRIMIVLSPFYH